MSPIYCDQCGRANGASAKSCIWCGVPMFNREAVGYAETTRVEIGYLDGIERLKDAAPVRLTISIEGVEVVELIPGTRSVKIPASSILETNCVDASAMIEDNVASPLRWSLLRGLTKVFLPRTRTKSSAVKLHDYLFTIKYQDGEETHTAVFHREDRTGLAVVEGLVRIVTSLIRKSSAEDKSEEQGA